MKTQFQICAVLICLLATTKIHAGAEFSEHEQVPQSAPVANECDLLKIDGPPPSGQAAGPFGSSIAKTPAK